MTASVRSSKRSERYARLHILSRKVAPGTEHAKRREASVRRLAGFAQNYHGRDLRTFAEDLGASLCTVL